MVRGGARAAAGRKRRRGRRPLTKEGKAGKLRPRRIHFKRARLDIVEKVVSPRGRPHIMAAIPPFADQPTTAQTIWMDSTAIRNFAYDPKREILQITFIKGGIYLYYDVPMIVVEGLRSAMSKGRYFYYNIRSIYKFARVK